MNVEVIVKTSEEFIQRIANDFELPVEKVALVWSVVCNLDHRASDLYRIDWVVRGVIADLFPE